jgi:hypothetical protein
MVNEYLFIHNQTFNNNYSQKVVNTLFKIDQRPFEVYYMLCKIWPTIPAGRLAATQHIIYIFLELIDFVMHQEGTSFLMLCKW